MNDTSIIKLIAEAVSTLITDLFQFHHFTDDSNLFYKHKNLLDLESDANRELIKINEWLCANKLSLNIEKSNFIIFHS